MSNLFVERLQRWFDPLGRFGVVVGEGGRVFLVVPGVNDTGHDSELFVEVELGNRGPVLRPNFVQESVRLFHV